MARYKYYTTPTQVIAVSTYAGKTVRGVAKCDPRDTFDLEKGKQLATARCNEKVAIKRFKRARKQVNKASDEIDKAKKYHDKMASYFNESLRAWRSAQDNVQEILKNM